MQLRPRRCNRKRTQAPCAWGRGVNKKLIVAFFIALSAIIAQDPTSYMSQDVLRVGSRLACRCGGCRNTVGDCPMLRCDSAGPMRQRISQMKGQGMSDDAIVNSIVKEEGIVALASPPANGFGLLTWVMPAIALILGFFVYLTFVRRNRKTPDPLTPVDQDVIERFRSQIDRELGESSDFDRGGPTVRK